MNKSQIHQILSSYFHNVDADIDIVMVGRIAYLDIQYKDFKPTSIVQKELSELLPRLEWTRLDRTFSKQAILDELWRMYHEDSVLLIQTDNDTFRSTLLPIYVQERLQFTHIQ